MKVNPIYCHQFHVKDLDKEEVINLHTQECTSYAEAVYLVRNQSNWKTSEDYVHMTVLPSKVVKRVGRPKKKRIPSVGEAPKLHNCGQCKEIGHKRLTCTNPISYTEKSSIQD
ncbi:MuDRA-like transposase [Cucumis melo var. makuwa]|uniref:MuDRA-like transposase n=1 Tax=Cucumis melo var. makuwa TaxID=1194695 RepID=A0A5D3CI07_CUCMM|nr:MuDRA-like transposase [Cucumis melo var. makuwa]